MIEKEPSTEVPSDLLKAFTDAFDKAAGPSIGPELEKIVNGLQLPKHEDNWGIDLARRIYYPDKRRLGHG